MANSNITLRAADLPLVGICWKCGYDLRGIDSRKCPECGWPFKLEELLQSTVGERLMKPTRWLGKAAIPIAGISLILDAMLFLTPITLLVLAALWLIVAAPYILASRRQRRIIFQHYPQHGLADPDIAIRKHVACVFLVVAMIVWSGLWQLMILRISLHWLTPYVHHLYATMPLLTASPPEPYRWRGFLLVKAQPPEVYGVTVEANCGTLIYSPHAQPDLVLRDWMDFNDTDEAVSVPIATDWYLQRDPWNFMGQASLNR